MWDVTLPDLSAAPGWMNEWAVPYKPYVQQDGILLYANVKVFSGPPLLPIGARGKDGDVHLSAFVNIPLFLP